MFSHVPSSASPFDRTSGYSGSLPATVILRCGVFFKGLPETKQDTYAHVLPPSMLPYCFVIPVKLPLCEWGHFAVKEDI